MSARVMWAKTKFGGEVWFFISAYSPGREVSEKRKGAFRSELSGCVEERKRSGSHVVVLGDLNARLGNEEVLELTRKHVKGRNVSGEVVRIIVLGDLNGDWKYVFYEEGN